jgi:hypothetical protein
MSETYMGTTLGTQRGTRSGHLRDSHAPSPSPSHSLKNVQQPEGLDLYQPEGLDLGGESERGPDGWTEPDAARLHENPGGSRPPGVCSDQEFRRLCKLVRAEIAANPTLDGSDLMEHLKCAAARARLAYDGPVLGRVLDVVQPRQRLAQRHAEPAPQAHWRDRCAHTPTCATPVQCDLRAAKEGM